MGKELEIIDSVEKLEKALAELKEAQKVFAGYSQEQVDKIYTRIGFLSVLHGVGAIW